MTIQPKPCATCASSTFAPGAYYGDCGNPGAGGRVVHSGTCRLWQSRYAPKPAAGPSLEQRAEELAAASLEERVREARRGN